jgi:putative DNA primase/helicase
VQKVPHDPQWNCNIGYDDPWTDDDPVEWLKFLDEVLADLDPVDRQVQIETIAEWMGAMLTRQSTKFQVAFVLNGGGSNGKSQFVVVVEGIVPAQRVTHFAPQNLGGEYNRAKLAKAILNSTAEVPATEVGDTVAATLKALISGEPMTGRFPYENPFDFVPEAAVLLAANTLPVIHDHTKGMWRRVKVIDFNQEFSGQNVVRNLGEKILKAERVQIACWALRHLPNLIARGEYRDTQANIAAKARWQSASDDVEQWIADAIDVSKQPDGTPCEPLYQCYRIWAESAGVDRGAILTKRKFFDRLKSKYKPYTGGPAAHRRVEYPLKIRESMSSVH